MHALSQWLGLSNGSGAWYLWWSGIFSDATLFTGLGIFLLHKQCHVKRCWRFAHHTVDGTGYIVCRKHHPELTGGRTVSLDQLHLLHRQHHPAHTSESDSAPDASNPPN